MLPASAPEAVTHVLSSEDQLASRLETYRSALTEYNQVKRRCEYLGAMVLELSDEVIHLRYQVSSEAKDEQLPLFKQEKDEDLIFS